jgi:hypothetical protein
LSIERAAVAQPCPALRSVQRSLNARPA